MSKRNTTDNTDNGRPITSVEVAQLAGVSQSSVSRVFSAREGVSSETITRVREAARTLGYKPNALASSMITRRTNMIGIVMAEIGSPFTLTCWKSSRSSFTISASRCCYSAPGQAKMWMM